MAVLAASAAAVLAVGASPERGGAVSLEGAADLVVTWSKKPGGAMLAAGKTARYVVTVQNRGPDASSDVTLELGVGVQRADIFAGAVSDGTRCTKEKYKNKPAYFVRCSLGTLGVGAKKTATIKIRALRKTGKTGGAILVASMMASSSQTVDPDPGTGLLFFPAEDDIHYSIPARIGGGKSTARRIRAKVLVAPEGSLDRKAQAYRRLEVFHAPAGARVDLHARSVAERGKTNSAGKLRSKKLVGVSLPVGSIVSVRVTKRGRVGDYLRIRVIAGGAKLVARKCIPSRGGAPRRSCR